jgi:hypothetical protein
MQPSYTAGAAGGGARMAGSANHRNATPSQWLNDDMQPRPSHTHAAGDGPDAAHFVEEKVGATHVEIFREKSLYMYGDCRIY